jgi:hypothetical protein
MGRAMGETGGSYGGKTRFQPGGTPGGGGEFLGGLVMMAIGIYMVFDRVTVHTSFWRFFGSAQASFGVMLMPLLVGVGVLAFSGKSMLGWLLTAGGVLFIVAGVLMNLDIYFQPTTLWATIVMFALIAGGLGLFAKSLRAHAASERRAA